MRKSSRPFLSCEAWVPGWGASLFDPVLYGVPADVGVFSGCVFVTAVWAGEVLLHVEGECGVACGVGPPVLALGAGEVVDLLDRVLVH